MKKRLTASERDAILRMNVVLEILDTETRKLEGRMEGIKYAKRDIGMMRAKIGKLVHDLAATIPDDQRWHYVKMLETATYYVGAKNPVKEAHNKSEYGYWLPVKTIEALLDGCHDKCMVCDLDKSHRRACPLRKAIDSIPNDTPERDDGDCQYYTIL